MPKTKQVQQTEVSERFPTVPEQNRPRTIIFDILTDIDIAAFKAKGYEPIVLQVQPRVTQDDNKRWITLLLQGVTDGTIEFTKERAEALNLSMQARGLMKGNQNMDDKPLSGGEDIDVILGWDRSAHQLEGTSTVVKLDDVLKLKKLVGGGEDTVATPKRRRRKP